MSIIDLLVVGALLFGHPVATYEKAPVAKPLTEVELKAKDVKFRKDLASMKKEDLSFFGKDELFDSLPDEEYRREWEENGGHF
jgi:hypothetical protein